MTAGGLLCLLWCAAVPLRAAPPEPAPPSPRQRATQRELSANQSYDADVATRSDTIINDVISRREFRRASEEDFLQRLQMMIVSAVIALLERVGRALGGLGPVFLWIGVAVLAVLLALLVLLLARLIDALLARLGRRRQPDATSDLPPEPALRARGPAAARQALERARALAAQGQWLEALRLLFASLLLTLDHSGAIDLREGRTNWEYLREARQEAPAQVTSLEGAIRLFEATWYGLRGAAPDDYAAMLALLEATRAEIGTPP